MLLQYIANGIAIGMAYAIVALGYSIVFGILRLLNFSHAAVYAFSANMILVFMGWHFGIWGAVAVSIVATGLLAVCVNQFALKPLRKKNSDKVANLITTVGASYIIQNLMVMYLGSERKTFPFFYDFGVSIDIGFYTITSAQISMFVIAGLLLVFLTLIIRKTKVGLAMRGIEQNPLAANLMGINVEWIIAIAFFMGGASAAVGGALIGGYYQLAYPSMGVMVGNKAFASAVLGGLGVLHGAAIGGLIVGVLECLIIGYLGASYRDGIAFVLLIITLIIKPAGLFGKKNITKV